jgi:hypothetical protein
MQSGSSLSDHQNDGRFKLSEGSSDSSGPDSGTTISFFTCVRALCSHSQLKSDFSPARTHLWSIARDSVCPDLQTSRCPSDCTCDGQHWAIFPGAMVDLRLVCPSPIEAFVSERESPRIALEAQMPSICEAHIRRESTLDYLCPAGTLELRFDEERTANDAPYWA